MAHYLVRAYPDHAKLPELREKLLEDEIEPLDPFGAELQQALERARLDPTTGKAVWEEEDHCSPPLAMEKDAVLDEYFDEIEVEAVDPGEGWEAIDELPGLWWNPADADTDDEADGEPEDAPGADPGAHRPDL